NERLRGMIEVKQVDSRGVNVGKNATEKGLSYAGVTARRARVEAVSENERHAVVIRPKDPRVTSENVKEKVLKDIQPKIKIRVNAVRMLRSRTRGTTIDDISRRRVERGGYASTD
ncbi:hypothetical protein CBL_12311, partial [Carabus blaptoides fortunei]